MKTIYLKGVVGWDITAEKLKKELDPNSREKVRIVVNSPGGDFSEGVDVFNVIKSYNGNIQIIIGAMAASAMSYIVFAVPVEQRFAFPNSSFMIHEASSGIWGRARDLKIKAERLEGVNNIIAETYSEGFGVDKETARNMMSEDKYFTGWEDLLSNNIISDVIDYKDFNFPKTEENDTSEWSIFGMENKNYEETTAKEFMLSAEDKIKKDFEKLNNNFEKAVAILQLDNKINPENNLVEIKKSEGPMNLQDFLKSNPEAQAEYDTALESAREQEREKVMKNAVEILKLESAILSKPAIEALSNNSSVEEYAMSVVKAEKEKREVATKKNLFEGLEEPAQTPGAQAKDVKDEEQKTRSDEDCKSLAKSLFGGKK
jgi:ATP-dependent protease ClpP protease subunit